MDKLKEIPLTKWKELPIPVYENVLKEVKEDFADRISETTSITDKSFKILGLFVTALSAILIYFVKQNAPIAPYLIFGFLSFIAITLIFWNIKGHEVVSTGNKPINILTADFDRAEFNEDIKLKLTYKNLIEQYWKSCNKMQIINADRVLLYDISLCLSILVILSASCYLGSII